MSEHTPATTPAHTSLAIVIGTTALVTVGLATAVGLRLPVMLGAVSGLLLAGLVWSVDWESASVIGYLLGSVLVVPVGFAVTATTLGTVLILVGARFPATSLAVVPELMVTVGAQVLVVLALGTAVFGAAAATGNLLSAEAVTEAGSTALRTALLPVIVGLVLFVQGVLSFLAAMDADPGIGQAVSDLLASAGQLLFTPGRFGLHLPTFLLLTGLGSYALYRTVRSLPIRELIPDASKMAPYRHALDRLEWALYWGGIGLLVGFMVAVILQILVPPRQLAAAVGPSRYALLTTLTTAPLIRTLAWWAIVAGALTTGIVGLLRRIARRSSGRLASLLAPILVGGLLTAWTALVAEMVLQRSIEWVSGQLPGPFATQFETITSNVVDVYGAETILILGVGALALTTASVLGTVWTAMAIRYVDERTGGVTVASLSLFGAAAFAGAAAVPDLAILGTLVGALLVWDSGEFGSTLGREIGKAAGTRRTELVHATATLCVCGLGAAIAIGLSDRAVALANLDPWVAGIGLLGVVAGFVGIVLAIR
jgi:hypothetical protein